MGVVKSTQGQNFSSSYTYAAVTVVFHFLCSDYVNLISGRYFCNRNKFLRKMVGLGFLNGDNAPTEDAKKALPGDIEPPRPKVMDKTVMRPLSRQMMTNPHFGQKKALV